MRLNRRVGLLGLAVVLTAAFAAVVVILVLGARPGEDHPYFGQFERRPLVMAHRGGKGLWPENTLYAFEQAEALGVDVLEMDLRSTADGVLVLMHDATVDRTTNGSGDVTDLSLSELSVLDAGYNWSAGDAGGSQGDSQAFPYRGKGIGVPTLEQVFTAFPEMPFNIEIKQAEPSISGPLCRLIRDHGLADQVLVASFDQGVIDKFRRECPEVASTAGEDEVTVLFVLSKVGLARLYGMAVQAVQVPEHRSGHHVLVPSFVDAAHRRNLEVHAWTINEVEDMRRLSALGVDGIITDYPDRLMELLGR